MQEIGIESLVLEEILAGSKTIEGRLGKGKFLKLGVGDDLSLRRDIWQDGQKISSATRHASVRITQVLHFATFREMLTALDYKSIIPSAKTVEEALAVYRQFYSEEQENQHGVIAFRFELRTP